MFSDFLPLIKSFGETQAHVHSLLSQFLSRQMTQHSALDHAVAHALYAGFPKRLRPFLVYAVADLYDISHENVDPIAVAIELIHAYSLVHDDLPDMDNSPLRRDQPSVWAQFNPATAILVGDALLTLAFQVISEDSSCLGPTSQVALISLLAKSAGLHGMVLGQMMDLFPSPPPMDPKDQFRTYCLKTGHLIGASCQAPALLANAGVHEENTLRRFGHLFGLIFQMTDDWMDRKDDQRAYNLSAEEHQSFLSQFSEEALDLLHSLPQKGGMLQSLIPWVLSRQK